MPLHQNSTVTTSKLIIGNCKIETSASAAGTYINVGAGMVSASIHEVERYTVQAGNAPDPLEGVSDETIKVSFEMIEYDASVLAAMSGGLFTSSTTASTQTIHAGGNNTITPRAFKFTNTKYIDTATVTTILTVYHATMDTGLAINWKSDNDSDPIAVMPGSITGKINDSLTIGKQLYTLTRQGVAI